MANSGSKISFYEIAGYSLILAGAIVLAWAAVKFNLFQHFYGQPESNAGAIFGEFGEFIGGIVGSLWALAGVFLFFATLTYQKREFELQRIELHKTQKIFQQQNFSTLFLSFIDKHNDIIDNLIAHDINDTKWRGTNFFVFFQEKVLSSFVQKVRSLPVRKRSGEELNHIFKDYFIYHFRFYQNSLDPYLKNLSVLYRLILRYRTESNDKGEYYSFITKASFTQSELFLIYHTAQFNLVEELSELEESFDFFEDMLTKYKVEHIVQSELHNQ